MNEETGIVDGNRQSILIKALSKWGEVLEQYDREFWLNEIEKFKSKEHFSKPSPDATT